MSKVKEDSPNDDTNDAENGDGDIEQPQQQQQQHHPQQQQQQQPQPQDDTASATDKESSLQQQQQQQTQQTQQTTTVSNNSTTTTTTTTNSNSLLPIPTEEMIQEYEEAERRRISGEAAAFIDADDAPFELFGIPGHMVACLGILIVAVTIGTVLAVVYYDPTDGIQPPEYPTAMPTTTIMIEQPSAAPTTIR
jgi:hypothetical protein